MEEMHIIHPLDLTPGLVPQTGLQVSRTKNYSNYIFILCLHPTCTMICLTLQNPLKVEQLEGLAASCSRQKESVNPRDFHNLFLRWRIAALLVVSF